MAPADAIVALVNGASFGASTRAMELRGRLRSDAGQRPGLGPQPKFVAIRDDDTGVLNALAWARHRRLPDDTDAAISQVIPLLRSS